MTEERHPVRAERPQVQVVPASSARREDVGRQPCGRRGQGLDRLIEEPGLEHPPHDVVPAEPPWDPRRTAAREEHLSAREPQVLGDLAARLPASDDQDATRGQRLGVPVVLGVELEQAARERCRARGSVRSLVRTGAHHDGVCCDLAARGPEDEPVAVPRLERRDLDPLAHRCLEAGGVPLEVGDDLVAGQVAIGIAPVVREAREHRGPVGRDQAEAVPTAAPG